jgi:hypothetical protein
MRQLGVALGALILAVALLVAVAIGQQAASQSTTLPAAGSAPVVHDHGWIDATYQAPAVLHDHGWIDASYKATRPFIPRGQFDKAHASGGPVTLSYPAIEGGGTLFTGIPYVPTVRDAGSGSNGTRFAQ